jgi:hypothetical protein
MSRAPAPFDYAARDQAYWNCLADHFGCSVDALEIILKNFPAFIRRRDTTRFVAHYELFKLISGLPGCIMEIGVFRGASLFTWSSLMETFLPGDRHRMVYGFDHFKGLGDFDALDGVKVDSVNKIEGGWKASADLVRMLIDLHNNDNLLPGVERCQLVEGDVTDSIPRFVKDNPGLRISLLHLDADLYQPTKVALEHLYPLVVQGGVICLDEYGITEWAGESRAADEYFATLDSPPQLKKFPFSATPGGYGVKP